MAQTIKTQAGASLIEISITIVIISITTLIIMSFSRNTLMMNQDAKANDAAILSAEQKITDLATLTYSTLPQSGSDAVSEGNFSFTRNWTITQSGYIIVAKVTVSWNSLKGTRSITLAGAIN